VTQGEIVKALPSTLAMLAEYLGEESHAELLLVPTSGFYQAPGVVEFCLYSDEAALGFVLLAQDGEFRVFEWAAKGGRLVRWRGRGRVGRKRHLSASTASAVRQLCCRW